MTAGWPRDTSWSAGVSIARTFSMSQYYWWLKVLNGTIQTGYLPVRHFQAPDGELVKLSPRECSIARLAVRGLANKEIAALLQISLQTVKNRLARLYDGLGVTSRTELFAWVLTHPLSLAGFAVSRANHPPGCACGSPYCSAFSLIDRAA